MQENFVFSYRIYVSYWAWSELYYDHNGMPNSLERGSRRCEHEVKKFPDMHELKQALLYGEVSFISRVCLGGQGRWIIWNSDTYAPSLSVVFSAKMRISKYVVSKFIDGMGTHHI